MTDIRLHTFLAVWREKSFTRAAETLHITQPAVTQHIHYLEEDLGQKLFAIRGRSISLTAAGEVLLRFAENTEAEAIRTRERIAAAADTHVLRFGATRTIGEFVMPECLAGWARDFPGAAISMTVDNSDALFRQLRLGELDFLFVEGPFNRDDFTTDMLFRDSVVAVCRPDHRLAGHKGSPAVSIDEILGETLIIREKGSGSRQLVESMLAGNNRTVASFSRVLEIGNIGAMKRLAACGAGIAFLYERSVAEELSNGTLARIYSGDLVLSHEYAFVCLKGCLFESEYRSFLEYCRMIGPGSR